MSLGIYSLLGKSAVFLVALDRPGGHEETYGSEGEELVPDVLDAAAADEDGADGLDEVVHRIDVGAGIGQCGHGARGSEEA